MSATSGGGSVSEGSEAGESSQSTMSVGDSPSTSYHAKHIDNVTKITLSEDSPGYDLAGSKINLTFDERQQSDGVVNMAFDYEEEIGRTPGSGGAIGSEVSMAMVSETGSEGGGAKGFGAASASGRGAGVVGGMTGGIASGMSGGMAGGTAGEGAGNGVSGGMAGGMNGGGAGGGIIVGTASGMNAGGAGGGVSGGMAGGMNGGGMAGGIGGGTAGGLNGGGMAGGIGGGMGGGSTGAGTGTGGMEKRDKVPEAVNLELVNMVPYSNGNGTSYGVPVNGIPGIPVKKDSEQADMSTPYDEYFVPVNEHKKYMRGEKLYVTKDKRRPTSWRRCLSWIVACTVISVVLIVAILAGTGVILSEDQNGVKEASVGRNFAGSNLKPGVSQSHLNKSGMYVPRSIESEFIVDNLDLDPALLDANSSAYRQFAENMENQLKMILFDKETLESAASNIGLRVVNVSRDPFKVNYRIGWNYKDGVNNPEEPIKMEEVKRRLMESLSRNQGYIDKYHIDEENIKVDHVTDICQTSNGGCSHICYYNYITQLFTCTCPTHLVLDHSHKNCIEWSGPSEQDFSLVPERTPHEEHDLDMNYHQNSYHHLENQKESTPQPEPQPDQHDNSHEHHHNGHHDVDHHPQPTAEPVPEPTTKTRHDVDSDVESDYGNRQRPHTGHGSELEEPEVEPSPEPSSGDVHDSKDHEPSAEPVPEPGFDSSSDSSGSVFGYNTKSHEHDAAPEPAPEPTPEPGSENEYSEHHTSNDYDSNPQPDVSHEDHGKDRHHHNILETHHTLTGDNEPLAEPTPEPGFDTTQSTQTGSGHSVGSGDYLEPEQPSAEPTPEPSSNSNDEEKSHTHNFSHHGSSNEDSILKNHEYLGSGTHDKGGESTESTPNFDPNFRNDNLLNSSHVGSSEHEKIEEPVAEPTTEARPIDQDDERRIHSNLEGIEPSDDGKKVLETHPHSISHSLPSNSSFDDNLKMYVPEEGDEKHPVNDFATKENVTGSDKDLGVEQHTSEHDQHHVSENSQLGYSTLQPPDNSSQAIPGEDSVNLQQQQPSIVESMKEEKKEHPTDELGASSKPEETAEGMIIGSNFYNQNQQENEEKNKASSEQTSEAENIAQQEVEAHQGNGSSNTESTTEQSLSPKENEDLNGKNQRLGVQQDNIDTNMFHDSTSGIGEHLNSQSKEGATSPQDSATTLKPDVSAEQEVNFAQTTQSPIYSTTGNLSSDVSVPYLEQVLLNDSISHPVHEVRETIDDQSKSILRESNPHVPSFQDILIQKSSPNNDSSAHNVSDSAFKKDSEPIIETIIIDKSSPQSTELPEAHPTISSDGILKSHTQKAEAGDMENLTVPFSNSKESTTIYPGTVLDFGKESSGVTLNPSIVEYVTSTDSRNNMSEKDSKNLGGIKETGAEGVTENSNIQYKGYEVTEPSSESDGMGDNSKARLGFKGIPESTNSSDPARNSPTESNVDHIKTQLGSVGSIQTHSSSGSSSEQQSEFNSERPENKVENTKVDEQKIKEEAILKTTIAPGTSRERATIPVTIIAGDFPSPYDGSYKTTEIFREKPRLENNESQEHDSTDKEPHKFEPSLGKHENEAKESGNDSTGKPRISEPQSTDGEMIPVIHGPVLSGTTKTPEDFFNNIKDENEDFNALIEQESLPGEGKDILLNKFANKYSKTEKKKVKDFEKKFGEGTTKPVDTPEQYSLEKHENEHSFDLDYGFPKEHATVADVSHSVPGVSFSQHGINNHDLSILQTVTPDLKTETIGAGDSKIKSSDSKEVDKDYSKFDKDYKYKEKGGKKKDLKKKIGGKDGKNVELDENRKLLTDSLEEIKGSDSTTTPHFERVGPVVFDNKDYESFLQRGDSEEVTTEGFGFPKSGVVESNGKNIDGATVVEFKGKPENGEQSNTPNGAFNSTGNASSPGTVYDGQIFGSSNFGQPNQSFHNETNQNSTYIPGTIFDGVSYRKIPSPSFTQTVGSVEGGQHNTSFVVYETTLPNGTVVVTNGSSVAHPTIIVRGQSGSLQDGHVVKSFDFSNGTSPSSENYQFTFSNGSTVHPTIVIRGQSGALQDGHESRFINGTFGGANAYQLEDGFGTLLTNSTVYRIENGSLPGTVFDGHFNPQEGHYHMFTNASGTYVYSNASSQPSFVIKGSSGDFGNSKGYILGNQTKNVLNHFVPTTWFSNGQVSAHPHNETIKYTHQINPTSFSSGTAYTVNNYFGYISKCAAGQFQCVNGTSKRGSACISLSSKCDSINDCSDGSDEVGCIESGCPGNFQCSDGSCLKRHLVCNGIVDCSDGSDEQKCESWKCEFDEFQCPSGRCIPVVWQCDNKPDCDNHTDEYNCQTSCGNDEYLCPEGWCIPLTYKCNGVKECSNGEDEQLCDCSLDEFKCHTGGCVSKAYVCNGLDDCPDRSDEWDCVKIDTESNLIKIRSASGNYDPICADNWTSQRSDEVCASLGYSSSVPLDSENKVSSIANESSFFILKNSTTEYSNKKFLVNLMRSNGTCSSGKFVEISCQDFSCGSRSMTDSSSVEGRLVGGKTATAGQWPSVALLYNVRNFHSCTANVLTPRWVLASYNCLKMGNKNLNQQDWKMFGGSTVFETEKETAETRNIVSIIPHPQVKFNQFLFSNDLALVELDEPLYFTSNVGAVCLPEQEIQPRQICVTAGWGMSSPEDKVIRQQLQYLPVPTMNLTECNSTEHYSGFITEDKICAGYNAAEKSLCYNEEGAPLMCVNDRGEWELQGVLSYHSNCGRGSHPSIFSSITPAKEWIRHTIGNSFERKVTPVTKR